MATENNQFEAMWDQFGVAMAKIVVDQELIVLSGNEAFFEVIGYEKEEFAEVFHNVLKDIVVSEDYSSIMQDVTNSKGGISIERNFRILSKDQNTKWILFKAKSSAEKDRKHNQVLYCTFHDITKSSELQRRLEVEEERYRLISEISDDITFEYDVKTDVMYFGRRFEELFQKSRIIYDFQKNNAYDDILDKETVDSFLSIFHIRKKVSTKYYTELKINGIGSNSDWYGLHYTGIFDENDRLCKVIGKFVNIDKQVREKEYLLMKSQLDPMTKLLNKITSEKEISQYLSNADEYSLGAMLIIDVDDFKSINDNLGHLFGDAVLKDIAKHITKVFRSKDVIGRIGGDEFMIYMKDISSKQIVYEKAQKLCEGIVGLYSNSKWSSNLSVSIGIAMQEGKSHSYAELFQNADVALYQAKEKGKNCYVIFQDHINKREYSNQGLEEPEEKDLAVKGNVRIANNDLIKLSLTALNSSNTLETRINRTLELIGTSMNVSKVVLGVLNQSKNIEYKYKWFQDVLVKKECLDKRVSMDSEKFRSIFNSEGIFYCNEVDILPMKTRGHLVAQDAKSLLQFAIIYQGKMIGTLGVQSHIEERLWVEYEVETLQIISQILAAYIVKG